MGDLWRRFDAWCLRRSVNKLYPRLVLVVRWVAWSRRSRFWPVWTPVILVLGLPAGVVTALVPLTWWGVLSVVCTAVLCYLVAGDVAILLRVADRLLDEEDDG